MNYADIKKIDVANGEGVRVSVFVSGCNHHCKGCFNQCAWDFNYGNKFTEKEEQQIIDYMDHDYIEGLSLLGGEPLEPQNQEGILPLVKKVKEKFPNNSNRFTSDVILENLFIYKEWSDTMKAVKIILGVIIIVPFLLLCCLSLFVKAFLSL